MSNKIYTIEQVKNIFENSGCKLLSDTYKNAHQKLDYICFCDNQSAINLNNFLSGKRCKVCGIKKRTEASRIPYKEVKAIFEKAGCVLLSTEYISSEKKLDYICSCGEHYSTSLAHFRNGQRCKKCRYEKLRRRFALDYSYVEKFFLKHGCKLLSQEYVNAHKKLKYVCVCGNESEICFDSFKQGNRCKKCSSLKAKEKNTLSYDEVCNIFVQGGCKLLVNDYTKSSIPMSYICNCGRESKINLNNFRKGRRCAECKRVKTSGENNYQWKLNRDQHKIDLLFRQKCYKILAYTLKCTGKKKYCRSVELLGYNSQQLLKHVISFPEWNSLKSESWHLDHVFPIKAFVDYGIKDISLINCLENLRPLSAKENLSKNCKYDKIEFENWLKRKGYDF